MDRKTDMISLINYINHVISVDEDELTNLDKDFLSHVESNLIYCYTNNEHLPIPVYSFIRPNNVI